MDDIPANHTALYWNHTHPSLTVWWNASSWSKHIDELLFFDVTYLTLPFMGMDFFRHDTVPYESQVSCLRYPRIISIFI